VTGCFTFLGFTPPCRRHRLAGAFERIVWIGVGAIFLEAGIGFQIIPPAVFAPLRIMPDVQPLEKIRHKEIPEPCECHTLADNVIAAPRLFRYRSIFHIRQQRFPKCLVPPAKRCLIHAFHRKLNQVAFVAPFKSGQPFRKARAEIPGGIHIRAKPFVVLLSGFPLFRPLYI